MLLRRISDPTPTAEQAAAIMAPLDRAVRVLAGPGAGKTFVIARRYAYLLEHRVQPESILAVTYTRDMAEELRQRITQAAPGTARSPAAQRQICTIHAACYRMLREFGDERKPPHAWQVRRALTTLAQDLWPDPSSRPAWQLLDQYLRWSKMDGRYDPADILAYFIDWQGRADGRRLAEARRRFDQALRDEGLLTFDDMLLDAERRLLTDGAFRRRWQARFRWLIVDEGQDTSTQAMRLLSLLAWPENQIFLVGDADQTLFRFAGGAPEHNLYDGFEARFPGGLTFKLTTNYRSTHAIVEAERRLIRHNYHGQGGLYPDRYRKELKPAFRAPAGVPVRFSMFATPEAEADAVAAGIQARLNSGRRPDDFFVGARTRAQLAYVEGALATRGLRYRNIAGGSFWALGHVQDVVAYVALAHRRRDAEAFKRVYRIPSRHRDSRWLGDEFLKACGGTFTGIGRAITHNSRWAAGAEDLVWFTNEIHRALRESGLAGAVRFVLDEGYYHYLQGEAIAVEASGDSAADDRLAELEVLVEVAARFPDAEAFVAYARAMAAAAQKADHGQRIVLSTIHRLKGQERPVVFGIGWSEGVDDRDRPVGLLPHTYGLQDERTLADERCAAFVLISRAKEECCLSGAALYRGQEMFASRFAQEAGLVHSG